MTTPGRNSFDRLDERSLVEAARQDPNAFAALYRRYVDRIYGYAMRRSGTKDVAEEVTSATFEKALRSLHSYRWREPGIGPWLFRIASNELIDVYRATSRDERLHDAVAGQIRETGQRGPAASVADRDEVRRAIAQLTPRYQRALTLRYFAELSNEEAAEAMGVTRATMAVVVHRGTVALRRVIEQSRQNEAVDHGR